MISVDEAKGLLLKGAAPLGHERVCVGEVLGRIAARDIVAAMDQPPFAASAMDGYAVRHSDVAQIGAVLDVIDEAPAGAPAQSVVAAGQSIRLFTGSLMPEGADHVIIQEDVTRAGDVITVTCAQSNPRNIRKAGIDFKSGAVLATCGQRLGHIHGAVFAAANMSYVDVYKRPRIGFFANGDELRDPGSTLLPGQIINSTRYALTPLIESWGGEAVYLGHAADSVQSIQNMFERGKNCAVIVAIGGASVGDYDYVKTAALGFGADIVFDKVGVRPGKPTWHGRRGSGTDAQLILGLPGNPASSLVTARIFLRPLIEALLGQPIERENTAAILEVSLPKNGPREHYIRAQISERGGQRFVCPQPNHDSSRMIPFLGNSALIKRAPNASALEENTLVEVLTLIDTA